MRIVYGSPPTNEPSGGVKVIYRHAEMLGSMGVEAYVWVPGEPDFRCTWFEHRAKTIQTEQLNPSSDLVILPEIWATGYVSVLKAMGFRVGIFVQNAYLTHVNLNSENRHGVRDAYAAADLILSISLDTTKYLIEILGVSPSKIMAQCYSINRGLFRPETKAPVITFMPRKMADHSGRVVSILRNMLPPGWSVMALDKLTEREVASALSRSIIFLAFSEFEGLPVPPVEAALAGNIVIGYHGQGGREYWNRPNFIEVDQGDIRRFVFEVNDAIAEIASGQLDLNAMNLGNERIGERFSLERERMMLMSLSHAAEQLNV